MGMTTAQLEDKISQNPVTPLFARLADDYLSQGKIEEARSVCLSGIEYFPTYPTGYVVLARCYDQESNYGEALLSIAQALELLPAANFLRELELQYEGKLQPAMEADHEETAAITTTSEDEFSESDTTPGETPDPTTETPTIELPTISAEEISVSADAFMEETSEETEEIEAFPLPSTQSSDEERAVNEAETLPEVQEEGSEIAAFFNSRSVPEIEEPELPEGMEEFTSGELLETEEAPENERSPIPDTIESVPEVPPLPAIVDAPGTAELIDDPMLPEIESISPVGGTEASAELDLPADNAPTPQPASFTGLPVETQETTVSGTHGNERGSDFLGEPASDWSEGRIVSRTLAEIYAMQGAFAEAILTYQLLKEQKPELREQCEARIRELEPRLQEKLSS